MARTSLTTEEKVTQNRERVPVHGSKEKFKFRGLDHKNFYYRLVRNDPDRIQKFLEADYVFVNKNGSVKSDSTVDSSAGTDSLFEIAGGLGVTLVLMALPRDLWEQDQKAKQLQVDELEESMKQQLMEERYGKVDMGSRKGSLSI
jgi:hypothetical protein